MQLFCIFYYLRRKNRSLYQVNNCVKILLSYLEVAILFLNSILIEQAHMALQRYLDQVFQVEEGRVLLTLPSYLGHFSEQIRANVVFVVLRVSQILSNRIH